MTEAKALKISQEVDLAAGAAPSSETHNDYAEGRQDTQDMTQVWGQDKHRTVLVTSYNIVLSHPTLVGVD